MNILIIHAHTANRGDEAAVKAMVDELLISHPEANITICINGNTFYPNMPLNVKQIGRMPKLHSKIALLEFYLFYCSNTKICFTRECKIFRDELRKADLVLHAPGGPSIGDIYKGVEKLYLLRLNLVRKLDIPYMFYAPSMGPFVDQAHNKLRRKVLMGARRIVLRDPISVEYVKEFIPGIQIEQALDSALQHDVDEKSNAKKLKGYIELNTFLKEHPKCLGITITDLKWHPKHHTLNIVNVIPEVFKKFIDKKCKEGYGIVFIPQLYGAGNDADLMETFSVSGCTFVMEDNDERYDTYFQQYIISKLYAVVGMRYHSNIFSAKVGTPFVSVSYEQKMKGFMESMNLSGYCLDVSDLTAEKLEDKFNFMEKNYQDYKEKLNELHDTMKENSYKSTKIALEILEEN